MALHNHKWLVFGPWHGCGITQVIPTDENDIEVPQEGHTEGASCVCRPWMDGEDMEAVLVHRCLLGICDTAERQLEVN